MPRKRPGFVQIGSEIPEGLMADLNDYVASHPDESKACTISLAIAKYIGSKRTHAELCPPLGRRPKLPPATPPKPARGRRRG